MTPRIDRKRYDVVIAGARCAGASLAMLLARAGMRVLAVDPQRRGTDTLSTHALMRGAVLQLHRWGLLEAVRDSGAAPVRETTFHYGNEEIRIPIKERDGIGALYSPRRFVLDALLADAAEEAGANVHHGLAVVDLVRGPGGRVRGARMAGPDRKAIEVEADLVVGADGMRSRVSRILGLEPRHVASHTSSTVYGYWSDLGLKGNHWYYGIGAAVGAIPTNDGETCVFASVSPERFEARGQGLEILYHTALSEVSPDLAERVRRSPGPGKLRGFAGEPGFLRPATGPGWALAGDAGYFKDPSTAHGITDALREAEFLAGAVVAGTDRALHEYEKERDRRAQGLFQVSDEIASFDWSLEEVKEKHLRLAQEMNALVDEIRALDRTSVVSAA
jgi:flavin-dependent dehydrogenase